GAGKALAHASEFQDRKFSHIKAPCIASLRHGDRAAKAKPGLRSGRGELVGIGRFRCCLAFPSKIA
ncbi:MAG TPA: hypothetical protein DHV57_03520, partial [Hyphomonas sp.]|nr:hypothetical protein [Hyphomonas sp.]